MAKVTIREIDSSIPNLAVGAFSLPIYIPGYAITGPENEPTLCQSFAEFIDKFGSNPYKFKDNKADKNGVTQKKDAYEKSYIIAYELAKAGSPIVFERITTNTMKAALSLASKDSAIPIDVKAKYTGEYGKNIEISVTAEGTKTILAATDGIRNERFNVTLDANADTYICNVDSELITVEIGDNKPPVTDKVKTQDKTNLVYAGTGDEFEITMPYAKFSVDAYQKKFLDKDTNEYAIFSTGAYPTYTKGSYADAQKLLKTVANYGLGFAVIDPVAGQSVSDITDQTSLQGFVNEKSSYGEPIGAYGVMFYKERTYNTAFGKHVLPPSYAYLMGLVKSMVKNKPWEAIAGTGINGSGRGVVGGIIDTEKLGGADSDTLQRQDNVGYGVRINPIQYIRGAGNVIMGNATLIDNDGGLTNYSFQNIRVLTTLVKRFFYKLGKRVLFEQNSLTAFLSIKSTGEEFMDKLVDKGLRTENPITGKRIEPYSIIQIPINERAKQKIKVKYYPLEAIEEVEEIVELADGYVNV